eukprot:3467969-Rhodomonas_salina.2
MICCAPRPLFPQHSARHVHGLRGEGGQPERHNLAKRECWGSPALAAIARTILTKDTLRQQSITTRLIVYAGTLQPEVPNRPVSFAVSSLALCTARILANLHSGSRFSAHSSSQVAQRPTIFRVRGL